MTQPVRWISSKVSLVMATTAKWWLVLMRVCRPRIWFGRRIARVLEEMNELRVDVYGLQYLLDAHERDVQALKQRVSDGRREISRARGALWAARTASERGDSAARNSRDTAFDQACSALNTAEDALLGRWAEEEDLDTCIF